MNPSLTPAGLNAAQLDPAAPIPLYHQIYLLLRERIRLGEFPAQSTLPSEQDLARLFGVSRITVTRALRELAAQDLVSRRRGRGTVVTASAALPLVHGRFDNLIDSLRTLGLETQVQVLERADMPAPAAVAPLLDLCPGTWVQRTVRLRTLSDVPFSYLIQYMPSDVALNVGLDILDTTPTLVRLEQAGFAPREAEQWITAVAAEPTMAAALDLVSGSPLLRVDRVMRDRTGRPVQLIHAHYRPDRFKYHLHSRDQDSAPLRADG